jgi:hypothetical protein
MIIDCIDKFPLKLKFSVTVIADKSEWELFLTDLNQENGILSIIVGVCFG